MSEKNREQENTNIYKSPRKIFRVIIILLFLFLIGFLTWRIFYYKSVEDQLADIQAELAIPDSENAAYYYREFFNDPCNAMTLDNLSLLCPSSVCEPWKNGEFPELSSLLEKHQQFMQKILEISGYKQTLFQIYPDPLSEVESISPLLRRIVFILSWSAANDLGEGRDSEAFAKYCCQIRIALQLKQQPLTLFSLVGQAIESVGLNNLRDFIMRSDITTEQLNQVESLIVEIHNFPKPDTKITKTLDRFVDSRQNSGKPMIIRFRIWLENKRIRAEEDARIKTINKRIISMRKGIQILLALQLHRKSTGKWPVSLDDIRSELEEDILIDPMNNSSYVYKLTDEGFVLYGKGENNIDDKGQLSNKTNGPDDSAIWPRAITQKIVLQNSDPNEKPAE